MWAVLLIPKLKYLTSFIYIGVCLHISPSLLAHYFLLCYQFKASNTSKGKLLNKEDLSRLYQNQ